MTRRVNVDGVAVGGGARISVQSMTNTDTRDIAATLAQIDALRDAGCEIVRCAVFDMDSAKAMRKIVDDAGIPVVADVHFDHRLGIAAVESGVAKLRINPGNIGGEANVSAVADCCRAHGVPIRIGVNSGSVQKDLLDKYGGPTPEAMVESALTHAAMLERAGFYDIVVSIKGSSPRVTVEACRMFAQRSDYPQHIGVTESGTLQSGQIKSAVAIGTLLMEGIGDTVRVSLSGDPAPEVRTGIAILKACGLRSEGIDVVACPTCGRTGIDVTGIAQEVEKRLAHIQKPLKIAVMGCVVNGPGEAREADIGISGGQGSGALFLRGQAPRKVPAERLLDELVREAERLAAE